MNIAIIGMGCVYPGALSPEELWTNILAGRRYFRISPDERLPNKLYYDPDPEVLGKTYCNRMAVISGWSFDPTEWKVPPITFNESEIVHWLALHTATEALKAANIDYEKTDKKRVGVILGNSGIGEFHRSYLLRNRWPFVERAVRRAVEKTYSGSNIDALVESIRHYYESPFPELREDHLAGNMANVISGRIANFYDFRSASYSVDGACASSLLAVTNACSHLSDNDMDVVLAGGVDVSLDPLEMVGFAKTKALANDDIRPYDERAGGMQTGEGCGIVVLASEDYARKHGYHIHALIKGWGISSDGAGGITQPKVDGQKYAMEKAYERAGYSISTVGYVEGHGTGTTVGDKVEITSLKEMRDEVGCEDVCYTGSIKANIGHTKAAAGVAGLIKATMALEHKILPPHVNCYIPNPAFGRPLTHLRPCKGEYWDSNKIRRASVSAFGFGGANTHITLEEANPDAPPQASEIDLISSYQRSEVILLSGRSIRELKDRAEKILPTARKMCMAELTDMAAALAKEEHGENKYRAAFIAETPWQLVEQLMTLLSKIEEGQTLEEINSPEMNIFAAEALENPKMAALFPGQGSHRLNMAGHFLDRYPFTRDICQQFEARMYKLTGESFKARVFRDLDGADEETKKRWSEELRETVFQQPSIVSCSLAVLRVMQHLGLEPDYATGHSLGEISALVAGKALDPIDALHIAALRAQAMNSASGKGMGGMAAVGLDSLELEAFIKENKLDLVISNYNSPRQNVVSGKVGEIDRALNLCESKKIWARKLQVSHAFHSTMVADAGNELGKTLEEVPMAELSGAAIYSTSTGGLLPKDTDLKEMLSEQIARPVRFVEAVQKIYDQSPDLWVEIGPGEVLSGLAKDVVGPGMIEIYPTDLKQEDEFLLLNRIVARSFTVGFPVKTERLFDHRFYRPFDPYDYKPVLIVNPCERPVAELEKPLELGGGISSDLMPVNAGEESYSVYLEQRSEFLKQMIEVDYNNWPGVTGVDVPPKIEASQSKTSAGENIPEEDGLPDGDGEEIIDVVIDWIAKRTGYPKDFITPEKKLRDDLNLDSIKAGELALMLSQKMGRELPFDLGIVANASIEYLVETVAGFEGQRIGMDKTLENRWIKDFGIELLSAPLDVEVPTKPSDEGITYVIGEENCSRTLAITEAISSKGLGTNNLTLQGVIDNGVSVDNVAGLVLVLPQETKHFYELKPTEYKARIENFSTSLFMIMQKVLSQVADQEKFHCLVVRPAGENDPGSDFDGGAGFFKTLSLEHEKEEFNWKWLTVPAQWESPTLGECVVRELHHIGTRVEYHYHENGERLSPTSVQVGDSKKKAPRLGAIDTILVSGGGKGITFEMAYALAKKTGVKLGLMGSSPLPDEDDTESELAKNLEKMRQNAVRHLYVQADVTSHGAVVDAVRVVERKLGKISAVLHGAGISRFSEFADMDLEDYRRCINIKATGLYNILNAVTLKRLKALHVISSVLGRTGMFRQADYTFANAWLDGATLSVARSFPKMHAVSIGYSVWEETGIGAKSGSLEMLQNVGVTPLSVQQGIDTYLKVATQKLPYTVFVCTGRLNPDVERRLNPTITIPEWRFLENVKRFVPSVELVAEAKLTHEHDRYIPEHVFGGTPLMPTVLGLEAMTEAAMACLGSDEVPVINNIRLKRPMIIPENTGLEVRTMALVAPPEGKKITVNVSMRSASDGFGSDHFEIDCIFGNSKPGEDQLPTCPELPAVPYPKSPEEFAPSPLFQGRFFRRITKIYDIKEGDQTLTEITVPINARYYSEDFDQTTITPAPAIRDAMLQAAGLMAPAGYLPESIEKVVFFRAVEEGEKLICWARATSKGENDLKADITLYDYDGNTVEILKGVVVKATSTEINLAGVRKTGTGHLSTLGDDFKKIANGLRLTINIGGETELKNAGIKDFLTVEEKEKIEVQTSKARRNSSLTNIVAVKRSVMQFDEAYIHKGIGPLKIRLNHDENGKPSINLADNEYPMLQVSVADSKGISAAIVSESDVGIDLEPVETRSTETWQGLVGMDGYDLALRIQQETGEAFDTCATRVWTLIEAGKKANGLARNIPRFEKIVNDIWLVFEDENTHEYLLSTLCENTPDSIVVSMAIKDLKLGEKEQVHG